ncbi:glutathione S-transferase N-terminal domain-containing protein [Vibrio sp. Isolate34]|uniref:glutathione S-transferase family protein n=1 Tax=Vibrio sp. Isolate34 TaxID=2908540 RepID=UPI001EFDDB7B|nr:glutathione S-transferase N-terminal domain-containing protein [Vibrio sp. Isolate34]MCG9640035.1 glutathione S-transferase N-terminal domain-containing protein [Vibrio sp. Isolate34]
MKLYLNDTSPFSRAVLATAYLCNAPIELEWVDPWQTPQALVTINPFSTIPVLETNDGFALTESLTICDFLLQAYPTKILTTANTSDAKRMSLLGMSKTLMEVAFRCAALSCFEAEQNVLTVRGKGGIQKSVQSLIKQLNNTHDLLQPDFSTLYLHVALDYVLFRHASLLSTKEVDTLSTALQNSPFKETLATLSLDSLSNQPSYCELCQ